MKLPTYTCAKCGHKWIPRISRLPKKCPACQLEGWDKPKQQTLISMAGRRFGRLVVIKRDFSIPSGHGARAHWICACDCGNTLAVNGKFLRTGHTKSCGCLRRDIPNRLRHGAARKGQWWPEYRTWSKMRDRCENRRNKDFRYYGGRGIRVCDRWQVFENFLADMGRRPSPQHSIDRINNAGNYEPGNCRWATHKEQMNNFRRNRGYKESQ